MLENNANKIKDIADIMLKDAKFEDAFREQTGNINDYFSMLGWLSNYIFKNDSNYLENTSIRSTDNRDEANLVAELILNYHNWSKPIQLDTKIADSLAGNGTTIPSELEQQLILDFSNFKSINDFITYRPFIDFFCKEIEKWKSSPSPHLNLWYAIYEKSGEICNNSEVIHQVVEYYGYLEKNDECKQNKKVEVNTEPEVDQYQTNFHNFINPKETTMKLTTPVTTGVTYDVNGQDINNMSKDDLFAAAMELTESIKFLKHYDIKSTAVTAERKQQKAILKTVIKYLDAKK